MIFTSIVPIVIIVLFIFIFVGGMIAAIAIPNILNALDRSRQKRAMANMRDISDLVEAYQYKNKCYPTANSIQELEKMLAPLAPIVVSYKDGWNNDLKYVSWKADPKSDCADTYIIASAAKGGIWELNNITLYTEENTNTFQSDIILKNGTFIRQPKGPQQDQ